MPPKTSIADRIRTAARGRNSVQYHDLMAEVFPEADFPKAMRYQANGGPPGCAMAFGKALRLMGARVVGMGGARRIYL